MLSTVELKKPMKNCAVNLDVRIPPQMKDSLRDHARIKRTTVADIVRNLILDYLTGEK